MSQTSSVGLDAKGIIAALDAFDVDTFTGNEVERLEVRAAARRLLARVESPYQRAWEYCFEHPVVNAALQTGIDLGLWKSWTGVGGGEKSIDDLVKLANTPVEPNLLRTCSVSHHISEQLILSA